MKLVWLSLLTGLLALPPLGWSQAALTCTATGIPGGVCVEGTITDSDALGVITITAVREALCVETSQPGVSQRREFRARSTQHLRPADGTVTFRACVSGELIPPCPEDATVNEDTLTVTTSPDNLGCTLPAP